jgi:TRAP-type C4-dicarboxylate transport system permease small subunit
LNDGKEMRALLPLLSRYASYGSALALVAMMLITVADVTSRALANLPITGAYDLVQLFLVGTVFLSIPEVFLRGENIAVDFVDHLLGPRAIDLLKMIARLLAFVFVGVLAWQMIAPALDAMRFHEVSPDLSIPMIVHWVLMLAGITLSLAAAARILLEGFPRVREDR